MSVKTSIFSSLSVLLYLLACSPSFHKQIGQHREEYKAEFLENPGSPLKEGDLERLRFYDPDESFRVRAVLEPAADAKPFDMPTYAGTNQPYQKYATARFSLKGATHTLTLYRSLGLSRLPQYRDYLFLPFKDHTNGRTTYGGGRYLDFRIGEIRDNTLVIDFNEAYNPYCAYSDGYQCPIPPVENHLEIEIEAGEMDFIR